MKGEPGTRIVNSCQGEGPDRTCNRVAVPEYPIIEQFVTSDNVSVTSIATESSSWTTLLKGPVINFKAPEGGGPDVKASLLAYECSGRCGSSSASTCTVKFDWSIIGNSGSASRNFIADGSPIAVGMYYQYDDWADIPWTETLDSRSWGGSIFDRSEKGKVGYASPVDYVNNRSALITWDESFWSIIKPLQLIAGETISLVNEEYIGTDSVGSNESIYSGDVQITATVTSCS